jgi:hypothetical protein
MRLYERFLRKPPKQSRSRSVVEAVLDAAAELLRGNDADDAIIADSQIRFGSVLARALAVRDDVRHADAELAAYVVTNMAMGIVHTSIWAENKPFSDAQLRDQATTACRLYLTQEGAS